ncbi:unnamed protein product [Diamesa serratosioi]
MNKTLNYLRSPELVYKVQNYFGVEREKQIDEPLQENQNNETPKYSIQNKFWYYLFIIGTELGDEIFYATFIPFYFWNIDSAVGRRLVFMWAVIMYVGQTLKDVFKEERPILPAIQLQNKWSIEYGLPSTHAMAALAFPVSIVLYSIQRYEFPLYIGVIATLIWVTSICLSRVYLGMHSVLDILVGLILTASLMVILVPVIDFLDGFLQKNMLAPIFIILVPIMLIVFYPKTEKWTPTRGDTATIVSVFVGVQLGAWLNYQLGNMQLDPLHGHSSQIVWPTLPIFGLIVARTIIGLCVVALTEVLGKLISFSLLCKMFGKNPKELKNSQDSLTNKPKIIIDLSYKFITYGLIGFNAQYLIPNLFRFLDINRPQFYTEI